MLSLAGSFEAQGLVGEREMVARQALLRESLIATARAVTGEPALCSLEEAANGLAQHAARRSRVPRPPPEWNARALAADAEPNDDSLRAGERWIGALLSWARTDAREPTRRRWSIRAAIGLALVVAVPATAPFWYHPAQLDYTWRTSSAEPGFEGTGKLGDSQPYDLLFHTREEPGPWVLVDMLKTRKIDRVVLKNRLDCCLDRGFPLVVEVSLDGASFEVVAQQDSFFTVWTARFKKRAARYVRVRSLRTTALHLHRIELP